MTGCEDLELRETENQLSGHSQQGAFTGQWQHRCLGARRLLAVFPFLKIGEGRVGSGARVQVLLRSLVSWALPMSSNPILPSTSQTGLGLADEH